MRSKGGLAAGLDLASTRDVTALFSSFLILWRRYLALLGASRRCDRVCAIIGAHNEWAAGEKLCAPTPGNVCD
jgi:hypothetical protein